MEKWGTLTYKAFARFLSFTNIYLTMVQRFVFFNSRDCLIRLDISKIVFFEGDGNYTKIITMDKQLNCLTMNLSRMEEVLADQLGESAKCFMRIGKRYIVNMNFIHRIDILKQKLFLSDNATFAFSLSISKEALKAVKELVIKARI